ncbi:MAG TPA: lytic murein transglycosylase B [Rhodocyclaceae bacterium]
MKHPLLLLACLATLTVQAKDVDFATRADVRDFAAEMAKKHSFDTRELLIQFHHARHITAVIKAIQPPKNPAIRSWQTYRSRFVEPRRIAAGKRFMEEHRDALARAEAQFGVPPEIVAAIIGVETIYGRNTGSFETFSALTTLAFDYPPRAELFRRELEALLLLARDEKRSPQSYRGSYAGALGLPQFLPSSVRSWAVDFDGDGAIHLTSSAEDAIGSVASFLAAHGWTRMGPIVLPTTVAGERIAALLTEGIQPKRPAQSLREWGVQVADDAPAQAAALIDLVTPDAPTEYRLGYDNFYVITRYNRSSFYATAVADLAAALKE